MCSRRSGIDSYYVCAFLDWPRPREARIKVVPPHAPARIVRKETPTETSIVTKRPAGDTSPSHGPRATHGTLRRRRDYEERLHALPKVFAFLFFGWCGFFVLDLYTALVVWHSGPLGWLLSWRLVGATIAGAAWL